MTILYINTGTSANAGNGDSIRLAFTKVNNNFEDLLGRLDNAQFPNIFVNNGYFGTIVSTGTFTTLDLVSTGTAIVNDLVILGNVNGPVNFTDTGTFVNIVVTDTATINHIVAQSLTAETTSTFNSDIIVNGNYIGTLTLAGTSTFDNIVVNNTATLNDITINGSITAGFYQGFDDFNIIKDDTDGLNFRLRNIHSDSFTEYNLLDNISGGLTIAHQNSTNDSGRYLAGENYIYGLTPTDTLNIGRYSDIKFYADAPAYSDHHFLVPAMVINSNDQLLRITSSTIYLNDISFEVLADGTAYVNGTQLQGSGGTSGASVTTSDTAPSSPSEGDLWYDTAGGIMYVYFDNSWIDTNPMPSVDLTQLINSGFSLSVDLAGVVNLPTITAPDAVVVQTASSAISLNANGSFFTFGQDGTLTFPDTSQQTGASISISELKTLLSTCNNFDDFKTAIAAL
jgi:hypothetical protein